MSPRPPTSRSSSTSPRPSKRVPGQPKSTRQQYSACGACRMRRVRCDLKDLPISPTGQHPPCSNCNERGLKCVDEFAEVKAVKLLRRGRRLQQVEAVYGQNAGRRHSEEPSWDGVRALLLILPLTQEVQSPMERLAMYEATISQAYTLCSLSSVSSVNSGHGEYVDALVRARIFWCAHVIDGVTCGLRGGRILLTDDDLASFETTLPPTTESSGSSSLYTFSYRLATAPIRIASVCREIHAALTGPKARQGREIDEDKLHDAWETLDQCWKDFDGLRHLGTDGFVQAGDIERFVDGWQVRASRLIRSRSNPAHRRIQIFIFECRKSSSLLILRRVIDQWDPTTRQRCPRSIEATPRCTPHP
ncbi:uncharacterized protein B0H18DRAFT_488520 [Fomitopsis serialis]|uniref:uncharacterized protein n=1 Tax=Fomitopsis serialis TaxID=139415 RepID=UPI002008079D|nr:uncharacterized protein B0H18DRAFT_488520 [Neoantrodia serialis]KAH9934813.1 hypothetical protein B0H18DRAFT_488520 [Neoantrodia serialis]